MRTCGRSFGFSTVHVDVRMREGSFFVCIAADGDRDGGLGAGRSLACHGNGGYVRFEREADATERISCVCVT